MSEFKGVIFDLDGVLVHTEGLHYLSWVEVLKPFGINFSKEEYFNYAGKREHIIGAEIKKVYNLNINEEELTNRKIKVISKWIKSKKLELMPYAREAIKYFLDKKLKLAVCSGSVKDQTILKLKKKSLYSFFPVIVSGDEVKRGKPYPDIYLLTAKKLGLKPQECLAFEDTQYGLESAKSAGLTCFAVPSEYSKKQDFSKADKIFKNLKGVVEWFKKLNDKTNGLDFGKKFIQNFYLR